MAALCLSLGQRFLLQGVGAPGLPGGFESQELMSPGGCGTLDQLQSASWCYCGDSPLVPEGGTRPQGAHYSALSPLLSLLTEPCLLSPLTFWARCPTGPPRPHCVFSTEWGYSS